MGGDFNTTVIHDDAPENIGRWASGHNASSAPFLHFLTAHRGYIPATFQQRQWREIYTWQRGNTRTLIDWFVIPLVWKSYHINAEVTTRWDMNSDHKSIKITIPSQKQAKKKRWTPPKARSIAEQGLFGEHLEAALQQTTPTNMLEFDEMITKAAQAMPQRSKKKDYSDAIKDLMDKRAALPRHADSTARRAATNEIRKAINTMNKDKTRAAVLDAFTMGSNWTNICARRGIGKKEQPPQIRETAFS